MKKDYIYLTRKLRRDTIKEIDEQFEICSDSTVSSVIKRMKKNLAGDRKFALRCGSLSRIDRKKLRADLTSLRICGEGAGQPVPLPGTRTPKSAARSSVCFLSPVICSFRRNEHPCWVSHPPKIKVCISSAKMLDSGITKVILSVYENSHIHSRRHIYIGRPLGKTAEYVS